MTRITSTILVIMLLLNGAITIMDGSGLDEDIGVSLAPGIDEKMNETVTQARNGFGPKTSSFGTLFSLFQAGLSTFDLLISSIVALPNALMNIGFPEWIVIPAFAPMYIISTLELIYVATGRDMV